MSCKKIISGGKIGFICSNSYIHEDEDFWIKEKAEEIKQYKFEFIKSIKKYTLCTTKDGYCEVMAHIENVGVLELNFEDPFNDVEECVSYWD